MCSSSIHEDFQTEKKEEVQVEEAVCLQLDVQTASSEPQLDEDEVYIETCEGERHLLSRRYLASQSHFFRCIFDGNYADSNKAVLRLPGMSGSLFRQCLSLLGVAARGMVPEISLQAAVDLLPVASYLCLDSLLELLSRVIASLIESPAIVSAIRMASTRHPPLSATLWKLLIRKFNSLFLSNDFLMLSQDEMMAALTNENLNIASRNEIPAVSKYIQTYPLESDRLHDLATRRSSFEGDGANVGPVIMNRVPHRVVLAVGGWSIHGPSDVIETFNPRNNSWISGTPLGITSESARAYHSLTLLDDSFVVCGGMNGNRYHSQADQFDLNTKEWHRLSPMREQRCYLNAIGRKDSSGGAQVIVMGGFNGRQRLSSCELFETSTKQWRSIPSMSDSRSDAAFVMLDGRAVAVGGFDGRTIHKTVEIFDFGSETWQMAQRQMYSRRTGVSAVALSAHVMMVAGGFNGSNRLKSAELYDCREGIWHLMPTMKTTRSNFGISLIDDSVFAMGGFDGARTTSCCEQFDIVAQRWRDLPNMGLARSALKAACLTDHSIIRSLVNFESSPKM